MIIPGGSRNNWVWPSVLWSGCPGGDQSKVGLHPVGLFQPSDSVVISVPFLCSSHDGYVSCLLQSTEDFRGIWRIELYDK